MEVTLQRSGSHRDLMVVEVVAGGEADVPAIGNAYVTADVQRLRELIRIAHRLIVELLDIRVLAHRDAIAEGERPRHGESHIAVTIRLCFSSLVILGGSVLRVDHGVVYITVDVGVDALIVLVLLFVLILIVFLSAEELLDLIRREGIRDILRHALEATELTHAPVGMVADIRCTVAVDLVSVRGEDSRHVERIILPPFQSKVHREVAQRFLLGRHVIGH